MVVIVVVPPYCVVDADINLLLLLLLLLLLSSCHDKSSICVMFLNQIQAPLNSYCRNHKHTVLNKIIFESFLCHCINQRSAILGLLALLLSSATTFGTSATEQEYSVLHSTLLQIASTPALVAQVLTIFRNT